MAPAGAAEQFSPEPGPTGPASCSHSGCDELKRATGTTSNLVLDVETLEAAAKLDFQTIGRDYLDSTRPRTGHTARLIDKMPLNFLYTGLIHRALPRAKIICLRRNALDSCLSNYRQLFARAFSYYNYSYDLPHSWRYFASTVSIRAPRAASTPSTGPQYRHAAAGLSKR